MKRRIVFHIGLSKTGTTSFQTFCFHNHRALRRLGILYPRSQTGFARSHAPLVASYLSDEPKDFTIALRTRPRHDAVRELMEEINASRAGVVLISAEHFSDHFDRGKAAQLAADFAAFDPQIVITLRDHHARFLSSYGTHVSAAGCLQIEDYADSMLVPNTRFMSAKETLLIWEEAFGASRLAIIDYDAEADVTAAIFRHCGLADLGGLGTNRYRSKASLGPELTSALRLANEAIILRQRYRQGPAAWLQRSAFSILCRRRLTAAKGGSSENAWSLSGSVMGRLDALAASDRAWLEETHGLRLLGSSTRSLIIVAAQQPASEAQRLLARALVRQVTLGLWGLSQGLVWLWERWREAATAAARWRS